MSMFKSEITLNGKTYKVEVIGHLRLIDGKTIEEFLDTITVQEALDLALVGKHALIDEKRGTKPRKYQQILKCEFLKRNN